jgi:hemolysin activation/secretion protein
MHIDTGFPRYSHQLKVKVDPDTFVRGVSGQSLRLRRGLFYILDTHSPHEVFHTAKDSMWNVTASIDHKVPLDPESTLKRLLEYARTTSIMKGAPV